MAFGLYKAKTKDWLVFCLGLLSMIKIRLLGTLGVSELVMIYLLFFKVNSASFFKNRYARILFSLAILWAFGALMTDLYRANDDVNIAKGLFSIILLIIALPVGYWCLYDKTERVLYYLFGLSISAIIGFLFQQSEEFDEIGRDTWQVYAYEYLAVFVAGLMFCREKRLFGYSVLFGFGFWSLFHQSRNVFLIFAISSVIIFVTLRYWDNSNHIRMIAQYKFDKGIVLLLLLLSVAFLGVKNTYEHLASDGTLGQFAKEKYEGQKNSSIGLVSGRGDFLISWKMIKESPIIGYGSYAKDKNELAYTKSKELGIKSGIEYSQHRVRNTQIPGHSYILGAWVYNGILGLPFWFFTLWLIFHYYRNGLYNNIRITPIIIIWSSVMCWDIFFSPFANRPIIVMYLSVLLAISSNIKSNNSSIHSLFYNQKR